MCETFYSLLCSTDSHLKMCVGFFFCFQETHRLSRIGTGRRFEIETWLNTVVGAALYLVVNNHVRVDDINESMSASSTAPSFTVISQTHPLNWTISINCQSPSQHPPAGSVRGEWRCSAHHLPISLNFGLTLIRGGGSKSGRLASNSPCQCRSMMM